MSELRRLESVTSLAERLLDDAYAQIEALLVFPASLDDVVDQINAAVAHVGDRWPKKERFRQWIRSLAEKRTLFAFAYSPRFGQFVTSVGAGDEETRTAILGLLEATDDRVIPLVPHALARGWPQHPDTLKTLLGLTTRTSEWPVFCTLEALGRYFGEIHSVRDRIFEIASHHLDATIRWGAFRAIDLMPTEPRTLATLLHAIADESYEHGRQAAVRGLRRFVNDPDVQSLLRKVANDDPFEGCRLRALEILAAEPDDDTIALLARSAEDDQSKVVRVQATTHLQKLVARRNRA